MSTSHSGRTYDLFRALDELSITERQLDRRVAKWQTSIRAGHFLFWTCWSGPGQIATIYYEILPDTHWLAGQPLGSNRRVVRSYSAQCPLGVVGTEHIAAFEGHLSREAFEQARTLGWPTLW